MAVSYGELLFKADQEVPPEWRDPQLQDRSRPIVTHCDVGPLGAISAKTLQDMGFTNVNYLEGSIDAWVKAGFPVGPVAVKSPARTRPERDGVCLWSTAPGLPRIARTNFTAPEGSTSTRARVLDAEANPGRVPGRDEKALDPSADASALNEVDQEGDQYDG